MDSRVGVRVRIYRPGVYTLQRKTQCGISVWDGVCQGFGTDVTQWGPGAKPGWEDL